MNFLFLDTEKIYTTVTQELLDPYGKIFDWSVKSKMMGRSQIEAARVLVEELQLPFTAEEFGTMSTEKLWELFPTAALLPGENKSKLIGHFQLYLSLFFKATLHAKSLLGISVFIHIEIGTNNTYCNKNPFETEAEEN